MFVCWNCQIRQVSAIYPRYLNYHLLILSISVYFDSIFFKIFHVRSMVLSPYFGRHTFLLLQISFPIIQYSHPYWRIILHCSSVLYFFVSNQITFARSYDSLFPLRWVLKYVMFIQISPRGAESKPW